MHMSKCSRASGASVIAALSYITAQPFYDDYYGKQYNGFSRKERVAYVGTLLPDGAPESWFDPQVLWREIDASDHAVNACVARKIMVALPCELTLDQQIELVRDYINTQLIAQGYAVTFAIHTDERNHNPHAHLLVANRQLRADGRWAAKERKIYALDERGQRIPLIDQTTGKQKIDKQGRAVYKRIRVANQPLARKETLLELRKAWADTTNRHLAQAGRDERIDHRSLAEQGSDQMASIHEGYAARAMHQRGQHSDRVILNSAITEANKRFSAHKEYIDEHIRRLRATLRRGTQPIRAAIAEIQAILRECAHALNWQFKGESIPPITAIRTRQSQVEAENRTLAQTAQDLTNNIANTTTAIQELDRSITIAKNAQKATIGERNMQTLIETPIEQQETLEEPKKSVQDVLNQLHTETTRQQERQQEHNKRRKHTR